MPSGWSMSEMRRPMADRTSAEIFGTIFAYLAQTPDERAKTFARALFYMSQGYDFSECQMECDDALVTLGLAKKLDDGSVQYWEPTP